MTVRNICLALCGVLHRRAGFFYRQELKQKLPLSVKFVSHLRIKLTSKVWLMIFLLPSLFVPLFLC